MTSISLGSGQVQLGSQRGNDLQLFTRLDTGKEKCLRTRENKYTKPLFKSLLQTVFYYRMNLYLLKMNLTMTGKSSIVTTDIFFITDSRISAVS